MKIDLHQAANKAIELMDLTTLTDQETPEDIINICKKANTPVGTTAAICIFPRFIPIARKQLIAQGTPNVKIATVTNFPHGNDDIAIAVTETKAAVAYGADEVDVVFPYRALISGDEHIGFDLVRQCKNACGDVTLKVIIETGELKTAELIKKASEISIKAGADFIKTSTGKVAVNATPESAEIMLKVIKALGVQDTVGFKPAGGVKTSEDAQAYLQMAANIHGVEWLQTSRYRFGASSLLNNVLFTLGHGEQAEQGGY